ncbi:MAG: hypothetical protein IJW25_03290 [Clostridia bacterium]|nr:hypothetical protein [Clostridia bacterium]
MEKSELEQFAAIGAYGIFWSIVEYMHRNPFAIEDIEMLADELRINPQHIKKILTEYELFREEEGFFISDRILRNLDRQVEKSEKSKKAAQARWILSAYSTLYFDEFGIKPILSSEEKKKLIDYSEKIENFKTLLPDIIHTLNFIKFDGDFNPRSNWLLEKNNLTKVLHEEFGKLRHKKTKQELKAEAKAKANTPDERQLYIDSISSKAEAIEYIVANTKDFNFIIPPLKQLMNKFDITQKELI